MNNKENIFEELNKMKNLIVAKAGTVISEQIVGTTPYTPTTSTAPEAPKSEEQKIADGIIQAAMGAGTDEKKLVDSINKIKNSKQFWNINSYLKKTGNKLDFAGIINDEMDNEDGKDVQTIITKLKSIGIASTANINDSGFFRPRSFKLGSDAPVKTANTRQTNINNIYCSVKNGVIVNPSSSQNGKKWSDYVTTYKLTVDEVEAAKKSCPSKGGKTGERVVTGGGSNSLGEYSKQVQTSLGVTPTGQLSDTDLDAILKKLEGGEISGEVSTQTQSIPMDANGQPDLDKILASL